MKRQSATTILTLVFIIGCVLAAVYLSQPAFQHPDIQSQTQQQTDSSRTPADQTETAEPLQPQLLDKNSAFCFGGCPIGMSRDDKIIAHHILELSNNPKTKFADWVAYKITADTLGKGCKRTWERDPDLDPMKTLSPQDYRGIREALQSDRGHQAPLASLCGSPYWQEADYLSNITPQKSELNEGVWEHLEDHERKLIEENYTSSVYSLTGPLYEREMPSLPHAHMDHRVPSGYWKVISVQNNNRLEAVGFIMDQDSGREDDYCSKQVSLDDIEARTHLRFFPNISENIKALIRHRGNAPDLIEALGCE